MGKKWDQNQENHTYCDGSQWAKIKQKLQSRETTLFDSKAKHQGFFGKFFERSNPEVVSLISGVKKNFRKKLILPLRWYCKACNHLNTHYFGAFFYILSPLYTECHALFMSRKIWKCWKFSYFDMTQVCVFKKTQIDQNFWTKRFLFGCEMYGLDTGLKQKSVRVNNFLTCVWGKAYPARSYSAGSF